MKQKIFNILALLVTVFGFLTFFFKKNDSSKVLSENTEIKGKLLDNDKKISDNDTLIKVEEDKIKEIENKPKDDSTQSNPEINDFFNNR